MGLEATTYINGLIVTNPLGTDDRSQGDDHIRVLKSSLKNTFPFLTGAVTPTHTELNFVKGVTSDIQTQLAAMTAAITAAKQALNPIGSLYFNATDGTNPATLLGFGTWVAFGVGRVLVGLDSGDALFDTAEETGGSKDAVVVSHNHGITDSGHNHTTLTNKGTSQQNEGGDAGGGYQGPLTVTSSTSTTGISINSAGVSGTNANLQPYITAYVWKRTL